MADKKKGVDFTELTIQLEQGTSRLCDETYAAIDEPPATSKLKELIARADAHIAHYQELLGQYDGGRKAAIEAAGIDVETLQGFTAQLKEKLKSAK